MRKSVGFITEEEKQTILNLFERKNGLLELMKILTPDNTAMYEKLVMDMGCTSTRFQKWWDDMSQKYQWESMPNGHWKIDFETNEIFLSDEPNS